MTSTPAAADYLLFPQPVDLPASGLLGVRLEPRPGQGAAVKGFAEDSGAKAAGVKEGDRIVRVGEQPVGAYADIRIALIDSRPGQRVPVEVRRKRLIGGDEPLTFEVELQALLNGPPGSALRRASSAIRTSDVPVDPRRVQWPSRIARWIEQLLRDLCVHSADSGPLTGGPH